MTIDVQFSNRDFSDYTTQHWDSIQVNKYSKHAVGGCIRAEIDVFGSEEDIWHFVDMIRCPVKFIDNERGEAVWWGFISKVEIYSTSGAIFGVDIDKMANRVALAYTYLGERETTDWVEDADSVAEYGQKDTLFTATNRSEAMADRINTTRLNNIKLPVRLPLRFGSEQTTARARILCVGWVATLAWTYYANDEGRIDNSYIDSIQGGSRFGNGGGWGRIIGQSFKNITSTDWEVTHIGYRMRTYGSPVDGVDFTLRENLHHSNPSLDYPSAVTLMDSPTISAESMSGSYQWIDAELTTPVTLPLNTLFWIHAVRSAEEVVYPYNDRNCFEVDITRGGYDDGQKCKASTIPGTNDATYAQYYFWSHGAWRSDLNFRVLGQSETTVQIARIISEAEFFVGSDILDTTGVKSCPYRNGDATSLYEIEALLRIGTANNVRLLATVTEEMIFRVYEEPSPGSADHFIDKDNLIIDNFGNDVNSADCSVGYWVQLKDIVPASVDLTNLTSATRMFVEYAEYDVITDTYKIIQARDSGIASDNWDKLTNPQTPFDPELMYGQG